MFRFTFIICFLFTSFLFSQQNYDGYILCIDNSETGDKNLNQYYYLPSNYLKHSFIFDKKNLEFEDDELEHKIRSAKGLKVYKNIYDFEGQSSNIKKKDLKFYVNLNFQLVYFHYEYDTSTINEKYFLKKIKGNKYYLGKIKFSGFELIDNDYLKSEVLKIFVFEIERIEPTNQIEQKQMIKFIKKK
ncbi:hypothetical protein [uncultured Aquimarina sp.]|uniref:hypothetical protein n=1 Tax=uncultured Aquimarina sp. TaxID=575652 RepID=UPI00260926D4|nr:hypothetical protein [uncultured Aquimarina sp.]